MSLHQKSKFKKLSPNKKIFLITISLLAISVLLIGLAAWRGYIPHSYYTAKIIKIDHTNQSMLDGCDDYIYLSNGKVLAAKCFWLNKEDVVQKYDLKTGDQVRVIKYSVHGPSDRIIGKKK